MRRPPSAALQVASALVLVFASTGCVRNLRAEEAYLDTLRQQFESHPFRISLPEAKLRILALGQSAPGKACAPCVITDACDRRTCRFRFGTSLIDEACLVATEEPYGTLRFRVTCGDPWRVENTIRMVWEELEPETLAAAETEAQGELARVTLEEARAFQPRWGVTGGAYGAFGSGHTGAGARLGVRRWVDPNLLFGALADYEWTTFSIPPAPFGQHNQAHLVSALVRAEVAPWSPWSAKTGLPNASVYMLAGPTLALDNNAHPGTGTGLRVGVGGHANKYTRMLSLPVFVEAHLSRIFFREFEATNVRVVVGLGF